MRFVRDLRLIPVVVLAAAALFLLKVSAIVVEGAYTPDPDHVGPPHIYAWMRFRDDPGERYLRQALFAQAGFTLARAIETHSSTTLRLLEGVPA